MADTKISAETAAGTLDGTEQVPLIQVGSPVTAGSFVTGTAYFILSIGSTDFTAIGAASNTVGLLFTASGAGSGTGTAGPALNRRTSTQALVGLSRGLFSQVRSATPTDSNTGFSSWVNQGSATVTDAATGIVVSAPSNSSASSLRLRSKTAPSTPYTMTALVAFAPASFVNFCNLMLGWYDGTKVQAIELNERNTGGLPQLWVNSYNTLTSGVSASPFTGSAASVVNHVAWLQLNNDGTNIAYRWSADGVNFNTYYTVAIGSGFLANYNTIVFGSDPFNSIVKATMLSWAQN